MAAALVALACGSRTSMLDSDVYLEPGETTGGSSAGSHTVAGNSPGGTTTQGGSVNVPIAGTQNMPMPTAGTGSMPTPSPLLQVCEGYCKGYAAKCPQEFQPGQECVATCMNELSRVDPQCQKTGVGALRCLTPFFANVKVTCEQAIGNGLMKCDKQIEAFKSCSGEDEPSPDPGPNPDPGPAPACPGMGVAGPGYCKTTYSCPAGPFTVSCQSAGAGDNYDCTCYQPSGTTRQYTVGVAVPDPCRAIASDCGVQL
jgi:hypothetical protein